MIILLNIYIYIYIHIFSAASRGSATAQVNRHLLFVSQNITDHLAEKSSKSSPNRFQNSAESIENVLGTMAAPKCDLGGRPQALEPTGPIQGLYFGSKNNKK